MLTPSDLIRLPFTPDLTQGGIAYALRSLPYTYDRLGGTRFDRLRRIVAGVAVELAFQHWLTAQGMPFDVKGATPFTDPDHYDVSLGGHRCDIKSFLITHRQQITDMRRGPGLVLAAPALVPSDQHAAEGHGPHDLYLFAFLEGLITATPAETQAAFAAGQPSYILHNMPDAWVRPRIWAPLQPLVLKSEGPEPVRLEVSGQDAGRGFLAREVDLPPRVRIVLQEPFHSVSSLRIDKPAAARFGIHSKTLRRTHVIEPAGWGNIWVYGMEILLAGWISRQEFSDRATFVQPGSRVFQYDRTRAKNLAVPISSLHPMMELLRRF